MKKFADVRLREQEKVNAYFQSQSSYWKDIYVSSDVYAEIHRDRHTAVLGWIDTLDLAPGSQVLEIGCGAGFMAIALAQRGLRVHAIDSVEGMIELAHRRAVESGTLDHLSLDVGDVYTLAFEDGSFDLVLAIGVIPWLGRPELAMQEMARVTRPGGHVLITADNRARLNNLLDPWLNPLLSPLKRRVKGALDRVGLRRQSLKDVGATCHSRRFIDKALARVELVKIRSMTLGFGPFSLLRRTVLPESLGIALHHRLQRLADRNVPIFRSTGAQYLVLTRKSAAQPPVQSASIERSGANSTIAD
jgi:ubiquinone/menaquinone biosynthesis C-methylase UbiE